MKSKCIDCQRDCSGERCRSCHIKFSGKSFDFGTFHFDTQTDLDRTIHQKILESPINTEFEEVFFSELLNKYHREIVKRNLRVTKFKIIDWREQVGKWSFCRDRFRGGNFVLGYFEPINEWHGVTLYPHKKEKSIEERMILGLRQKWSENAKVRSPDQVCEICHGPYPQLHHDSLSFQKIAEFCLNEFTEEEKKNNFGYDWWLHENEADALYDNHPAVKKLHELHEQVIYRWLCIDCHRKAHRGEL